MPAEQPARILVVDDTPQNVALLRTQLELDGHTVLAAGSGEEGLDVVARGRPDVVLLDVVMPGMDGYEVCRRLKQDPATHAIPVVIVTSLRERTDKLRALEAGAEDFLSRPVDRAELLARVRSLVRLKRYHEQVSEQAEQLAVEKNRAEAILLSMSDGVLTTDLERRIVFLNPAAEVLTGVASAGARGRLWHEALQVGEPSGEALRDDACPLRAALEAGAPVAERELVIRRADDRRVDISLAAAPVRSTGGLPVGLVAVLRDVTRQREVERMQQEFASLVSHELRTPLASIYGFAELVLAREPLSAEGRSFVETIFREAQMMTNLINDFLDVRRLESGRIAYEPRPVALHDVLSNVQYQFAPQLTDHRLLSELPARALIVHVDPERLTQVLMNLVSNAIKYSPSGGDVHISARVEGDRLVVSVRDQGLGLPAGAIARLFEQFYRVEEHRQHGIEGTGLGLAICRQIVEEMGGRIWAESPGLGHGSTFSFTVPLAAISG